MRTSFIYFVFFFDVNDSLFYVYLMSGSFSYILCLSFRFETIRIVEQTRFHLRRPTDFGGPRAEHYISNTGFTKSSPFVRRERKRTPIQSGEEFAVSHKQPQTQLSAFSTVSHSAQFLHASFIAPCCLLKARFTLGISDTSYINLVCHRF